MTFCGYDKGMPERSSNQKIMGGWREEALGDLANGTPNRFSDETYKILLGEV
jgi:hypothetical protein